MEKGHFLFRPLGVTSHIWPYTSKFKSSLWSEKLYFRVPKHFHTSRDKKRLNDIFWSLIYCYVLTSGHNISEFYLTKFILMKSENVLALHEMIFHFISQTSFQKVTPEALINVLLLWRENLNVFFVDLVCLSWLVWSDIMSSQMESSYCIY